MSHRHDSVAARPGKTLFAHSKLASALAQALPLLARRRISAPQARVAAMVAGLLMAPAAMAQNTWTTVGTGDWFNGANWLLGVPTPATPAFINNGGTAQVTSNGGITSGDLIMGGTGQATLNVTSGGVLGIAGSNIIGSGAAANLVVENGGALGVAANVNLGNFGAITVQNGGILRAGATIDSLGSSILIQGQGSRYETGIVAQRGQITIRDGGALLVTNPLGAFTFADGVLEVRDSGSSLTIPGPLNMGNNGLGPVIFRVLNGATVSAGTGGVLGNLSGTGADGLVDGAGSTLAMTSPNTVFNVYDNATLTVSNGGLVDVQSQIGVVSGGSVLVDGIGSHVNVGTNFGGVFGNSSGSGTLTAQNGGRVTGARIALAVDANAVGTLNVGTGGVAGLLQVPSVVGAGGTANVNFNHIDDIAVPAVFSGVMNFNKRGAGSLQLDGANTYSGPTNVEAGVLKAGAADVFSPDSTYTVAAGATMDLAGRNQSIASLANAGMVSLVGSAPGTTLTVNGPLVGNNGTVRIGTALGDSTSVTDRLILNGPTAIASGTTNVQIVNLGGLGAATTGNGIEVISAQNGATTTAQTTQNAFTLANGMASPVAVKGVNALQATRAVGGHVDAGAFEYRLYAADAAGNGENWYLRSTVPVAVAATPGVTPSVPGVTPSTPSVVDVTPPAGVTPVLQALSLPAYRAEVPLYAGLPAQFRQANMAMIGNLHRRIGDEEVAAKGTATAPAATATGDRRAWGRVISADLDIRQRGTVSPESEGRVTGFQAGTDLYADSNWKAGVYVGTLDGDARVRGFASGTFDLAVGHNDLRSRYLGGYVTYRNADQWYADAVIQAGRHSYTVQPSTAFQSSGKASSLLGSIEVGKAFDLGDSWKIEPSVQLIHQRQNFGDSLIPGATVRQNADSGWVARAGVRVKGDISTRIGSLQPYARFNVYSHSSGADIATFAGPAGATDISSRTGGVTTELAGGLTLAVSPSVSVYAEAGKLRASGGQAKIASSLQGSVGVKVRW